MFTSAIRRRIRMSAVHKKLVAFDFDHTLIDDNSDLSVRQLLPGGKVPEDIKSIYSNKGWTLYMAAIFKKLHEHGTTPQAMLDFMKRQPFTGGMKDLLQALSAEDHEVIVISDSNSVFIDCILKEGDVQSYVTKVFTNPAKFDDNGCLLLDFYHRQDWCDLSTVNLCKGHILDSYIDERKKEGVTFDQVAYVGDGHNDLCPSLRLKSGDLVFARKGFRLLKAINNLKNETSKQLNAKVIAWDSGSDIMKELSLAESTPLHMQLK